MKIQIETSEGRWIETGWAGNSSLAEVLADETRAIAARRVDCFGRVIETREASFERQCELLPQ